MSDTPKGNQATRNLRSTNKKGTKTDKLNNHQTSQNSITNSSKRKANSSPSSPDTAHTAKKSAKEMANNNQPSREDFKTLLLEHTKPSKFNHS